MGDRANKEGVLNGRIRKMIQGFTQGVCTVCVRVMVTQWNSIV